MHPAARTRGCTCRSRALWIGACEALICKGMSQVRRGASLGLQTGPLGIKL